MVALGSGQESLGWSRARSTPRGLAFLRSFSINSWSLADEATRRNAIVFCRLIQTSNAHHRALTNRRKWLIIANGRLRCVRHI